MRLIDEMFRAGRMRLRVARLAIGAAVGVAVGASGCNDRFGVCRSESECEPAAGSGGEADGPGGAESASQAGELSPGGGGELVNTGGQLTSSTGGVAAAGEGAGGAPTGAAHCEVYYHWLVSTFAFPDGTVLGAADFPSAPWLPSTGLKLESGRLTGSGTTRLGQGVTLDTDHSRLRFRVRFSDARQQVSVAFNAKPDGSGGTRISLNGEGKLVVSDGDANTATEQLSPLFDGVDRFVEAVFVDSAVNVAVTRTNYAMEKGALLDGSLPIQERWPSSRGVTMSATLSGVGISASLDDLLFSRCGREAPAYSVLLSDDFERPDSMSLGSPRVPSGAAWLASAPDVTLESGALVTDGVTHAAVDLGVIPSTGVRIRATVRPLVDATGFWADVVYNAPAIGSVPSNTPGIWAWGAIGGRTFLRIFGAGQETAFENAAISAGTDHFLEFDRDGDVGLLTLRTGSFTGPVLAALPGDNVNVQNVGSYFRLGSEGPGIRFEDVLVEVYAL